MAGERPALPEAVPDALGDPVRVTVAGLAALAVLARLVGLGTRVAHFDEARVAWWTLEFLRTGEFHYRFIIHGPFLQHANRAVFALFGASDFAMRLVPALVGGLLPLAALLFRDRLRDAEVVALAVLLAASPVLLYYSRFSRSTVLVAGFAFVAFGLFVRAVDTRRARYAHAGVAFLALGFAAKENAVVYVACWLGALGVVGAYRLGWLAAPFSPAAGASGTVRERAADLRAAVAARWGFYARHALGAAALFLAVSVFFYAPRAGGGGGVGLWQVVGAPGRAPAVLEATLADVTEGYAYWFGRPGTKAREGTLVSSYVETLGQFAGIMVRYGGALTGLSVLGYLAEHRPDARPRDLVVFAAAWGYASVLGYPLGTDISAGWITVNALVPLAVPAAVGLALVVRWAREARADEDRVSVALAALLVLALVGGTGTVAADAVYRNPTAPDNELVQFAQPAQDMRATVGHIERAAPGDDPDVLVVGEPLVGGARPATLRPACLGSLGWFDSLPLPWYAAVHGADTACAPSVDDVGPGPHPPVVVAPADLESDLGPRLAGYEPTHTHLRTFSTLYTDRGNATLSREIVVFVRDGG